MKVLNQNLISKWRSNELHGNGNGNGNGSGKEELEMGKRPTHILMEWIYMIKCMNQPEMADTNNVTLHSEI